MIRRWSPATVAPPIGTYSHLAQVPADHELVIVAGQVGTKLDGSLAGDSSQAQTDAALTNLELLLTAAGAEPRHLVKVFSMVAGAEHLEGFRAALKERFRRWFPEADWPTHSLIVVQALARPDILVELEAVAAIPR